MPKNESWKEHVRQTVQNLPKTIKLTVIAKECGISVNKLYAFKARGYLATDDFVLLTNWLQDKGYLTSVNPDRFWPHPEWIRFQDENFEDPLLPMRGEFELEFVRARYTHDKTVILKLRALSDECSEAYEKPKRIRKEFEELKAQMDKEFLEHPDRIKNIKFDFSLGTVTESE